MLFAINHMTCPRLSFQSLIDLAGRTGCSGLELRNDLSMPLFDGLSAVEAREIAMDNNIKLFGLAEVSAFNDLSSRAVEEADKLASQAVSCGALGVALIPRNDGKATSAGERQEALYKSLESLSPVFRKHGVQGFVEPLGFIQSSLRCKREVVDTINALDVQNEFKLIHDTFHHHLADETEVFPQHTAMVHVSGVIDTGLSAAQMLDSHRVLVNESDRLRNIEQLRQLNLGGYDGPVSMEAFAQSVHMLDDAGPALSESFRYIQNSVVS